MTMIELTIFIFGFSLGYIACAVLMYKHFHLNEMDED